MKLILLAIIAVFAPSTLCTFLPGYNIPSVPAPIPLAGSPVVPVGPVVPTNSYVENAVAHVHGYVEKPVEYYYNTYKLAPKIEQVPKINFVPEVKNIQGLAKVPHVYNLDKVAYAPKSVEIESLKVVPVPKTVSGYVVQPTVYTRPQLEYVPDSQLVKTVAYKPVVLTKFGLKYVPRDEIVQGVKVNVVQQEVPGYRLAPKTYTQTGVRYSVYQYPVQSYRYEPRDYVNTKLVAVPVTQQQLGVKLLPKDYIVKTYEPIVLNSLATSTSTGAPIISQSLNSQTLGGLNLQTLGALNMGYMGGSNAYATQSGLAGATYNQQSYLNPFNVPPQPRGSYNFVKSSLTQSPDYKAWPSSTGFNNV